MHIIQLLRAPQQSDGRDRSEQNALTPKRHSGMRFFVLADNRSSRETEPCYPYGNPSAHEAEMPTRLSPTQKEVLPPLVRKFRQAIAPGISARSEALLPDILYHYTTAAGLEGIVRERKLRATNFSFMNDPSEVQHGRDLVEAALTERLDAASGIDERFFQFVVGNFNKEMLAEVYVCCFTKLEDDLSQWRAYGASATERYSIGFDSEEIEGAAAKQPHVAFTYVDYDLAMQLERIETLLDRAISFIHHNNVPRRFLFDFGATTASRLAGLVPALKEKAYKAESEWRIIIWARPGVDKPLYDTRRGVLRTYLELNLPSQLPIASLHVLAPTRKDLAMKASSMLLSDAGVVMSPEYSAIPFAE